MVHTLENKTGKEKHTTLLQLAADVHDRAGLLASQYEWACLLSFVLQAVGGSLEVRHQPPEPPVRPLLLQAEELHPSS